jgi:glycosyltransferase involved in cell wall biosynthesis
VLFLGKEILSKGLDLLLAAWPLVLQRQPDAHLVVAGFGAWHTTALRMTDALAAATSRRPARSRSRDAPPRAAPAGPLRHLLAFLDGLEGDDRQRYLDGRRPHARARDLHRAAGPRELADLLPACEALVVPSTFPEAYGMVAAEAGVLRHAARQRRPLRPGRGEPRPRSRRAA